MPAPVAVLSDPWTQTEDRGLQLVPQPGRKRVCKVLSGSDVSVSAPAGCWPPSCDCSVYPCQGLALSHLKHGDNLVGGHEATPTKGLGKGRSSVGTCDLRLGDSTLPTACMSRGPLCLKNQGRGPFLPTQPPPGLSPPLYWTLRRLLSYHGNISLPGSLEAFPRVRNYFLECLPTNILCC